MSATENVYFWRFAVRDASGHDRYLGDSDWRGTVLDAQKEFERRIALHESETGTVVEDATLERRGEASHRDHGETP